jgi:hypothetical protein
MRGGNGVLGVVLFDKGEQAVKRTGHGRTRRELRTVSKVASAPNHRNVDAGQTVFFHPGQDIDILVLAAVDELPVKHGLKHPYLVPTGSSLLEGQPVRSGLHSRSEVVDYLTRAAV